MTRATLAKICQVVANSRRLIGQTLLEVLWHAGEPLAAGLAFYREARTILKETLETRCSVQQTFQTNATLVSEQWCEYFRETHSQVGVSIDGPKELHDVQRSRRSGAGSFDAAMRGITILRDHGIAINALCVLTAASLNRPEGMFDFFFSNGILNLAFNVEEVEGVNFSSSISRNLTTLDVRRYYSDFMRRFLEENRRHRWPITVREFQVQSQRLLHRSSDRSFCANEAESHCGSVVTVSRDGEVFSWSPELASGTPESVRLFSLGNVHSIGCIDELLDSHKALEIQSEIDLGIEQCRACNYFSVCGGGLPSNKFYENGSFNSTETLRCRLQIQEITEVLLEQSTKTRAL